MLIFNARKKAPLLRLGPEEQITFCCRDSVLRRFCLYASAERYRLHKFLPFITPFYKILLAL